MVWPPPLGSAEGSTRFTDVTGEEICVKKEETPSRPPFEAQGSVGSGGVESQVKQEDDNAETNSHPSHGPGSQLPADHGAPELSTAKKAATSSQEELNLNRRRFSKTLRGL